MANTVEILVTARNLARPALESATADARGLGGVLGKTGIVAGAALAGIAVASVKMASDFQTATTRLVTSAGESTGSIDMIRKGLLSLAGQVGDTPQELAKGMYTVESAGFHGAKGLEVLKAAAQGAKDEGADLTTVANGVTTVLNDFGPSAGSAADVTSKLVKAVSYGKTTFQDFSGALSNVLPTAANAKVSLADVTGVMAQMTARGISADQASQQIANTLRHLINPTSAQTKEFEKLGITSQDVSGRLSKDGLAGTLEYLSQTAERAGKVGTPAYNQALAKLTGTASGLQVALATTGDQAGKTQAAIKGIAGASADAKGNVEGFTTVQKTLGQQVDQLKAGFDALIIQLGTALIPVVTSVVSWFNKHHDVAVALVAVVGALAAGFAAYALVMKTVTVVTKLWAAAQAALNFILDANPIGIVIIAIAALAAGIIYAYKHSETFRNIVQSAWTTIQLATDALVRFAVQGFKFLLDVFLSVAEGIVGGAATAFGWVPGLGPKLRSASQAFQGFQRDIDSSLNGMIGKTREWDDSVRKATVRRTLTVDISDWQRKLTQARNQLKSVPTSQKANVQANIDDLLRKIAVAREQLDAINGKTSTTYVNTVVRPGTGGARATFAHGGVTGAAVGGPRNGNVLVGEHGPELVSLPGGSTVHSNPDTQRMLGEGGSRPVSVQLEWVGTSGGDEFLTWLRRNIRIKGGNVQTVLGANR